MTFAMEIVAILLVLICSTSAYLSLKIGELFNPINIFLISMGTPLIGAGIAGNTITPTTIYLNLILLGSFVTGGLISAYINSKYKINFDKRGRNYSLFQKSSLLYIALSIGIFGLIIGFINAYQRSQMGPGNPFFNLRYVRTVMGIELGIEKYLVLGISLAALFAILSGRNVLAGILTVCWASTAIWTMARIAFIRPLVVITVIYYLVNSDKISTKHMVRQISSVLFVAVSGFLISGVIIGKTGSLLGHLHKYLVGPIVRFDQTVLGVTCDTSVIGRQTLYFVTRILQVLGGNVRIDYADCVPTSPTYSFIGVPYLDFGVYGVLFVPAILAYLYVWLYSLAQNENPYAIMLYGIISFPLAISFFEYTVTTTGYLYYFALIFLLWSVDVTITQIKNPKYNDKH